MTNTEWQWDEGSADILSDLDAWRAALLGPPPVYGVEGERDIRGNLIHPRIYRLYFGPGMVAGLNHLAREQGAVDCQECFGCPVIEQNPIPMFVEQLRRVAEQKGGFECRNNNV